MARIIDISGQIESNLWDYNVLDLGVRFPTAEVSRVASIPKNGFDAHAITVSTLSGTYTETAAHLVEGAPTLDQIPLEQLIRPARLMRLPYCGPRSLIRAEDLAKHDPGLVAGEALLIDTGWGRSWNQPGYVSQGPAFSADTLQWFIGQPFSVLVLDTPVMECLWCKEEGLGSEQGDLLLPLYERGMILIAPAVNLHDIASPTGTLISLPMSVRGVCSAPCRAIFVEGASWADEVTPAS
jgi:kynurenine formamidase